MGGPRARHENRTFARRGGGVTMTKRSEKKGQSKAGFTGTPLGSGPGIFGCYGKVVRVIAVNCPPVSGAYGFEFACGSNEQAHEAVMLLRAALGKRTKAAKALRENNSY